MCHDSWSQEDLRLLANEKWCFRQIELNGIKVIWIYPWLVMKLGWVFRLVTWVLPSRTHNSSRLSSWSKPLTEVLNSFWPVKYFLINKESMDSAKNINQTKLNFFFYTSVKKDFKKLLVEMTEIHPFNNWQIYRREPGNDFCNASSSDKILYLLQKSPYVMLSGNPFLWRRTASKIWAPRNYLYLYILDSWVFNHKTRWSEDSIIIQPQLEQACTCDLTRGTFNKKFPWLCVEFLVTEILSLTSQSPALCWGKKQWTKWLLLRRSCSRRPSTWNFI